MTARATTTTAEPIHSFDHSGLADLPEYAAASAALLALSEVIDRNGLGVGARQWPKLAEEMAAALPRACTRPGSLSRAPSAGSRPVGSAPTTASSTTRTSPPQP